MKKRTDNKKLGWSYPELEKNISVYGSGFEFIDIPQGIGDVYSKRGTLANGEEVVVIFASEPTSEDGVVIDFIQQQWMIHNKHTTTDGAYTSKAIKFDASRTNEVVVSTKALCEMMDIGDTPSNQNKIYRAIQTSKNMSIVSSDKRYVYEYSIISEFKYDTLLDEFTITLSPMYLERFCNSKMRPTFIDNHMELSSKGSLAVELKRLLVARGSGNDRMPTIPQSVNELYACLGLDRSLRKDTGKFERALKKFKEVEGVESRYSKKIDAYIFSNTKATKQSKEAEPTIPPISFEDEVKTLNTIVHKGETEGTFPNVKPRFDGEDIPWDMKTEEQKELCRKSYKSEDY